MNACVTSPMAQRTRISSSSRGAASRLLECLAGEREVVFGGVGAGVAPAKDARQRLAGLQVAEQG